MDTLWQSNSIHRYPYGSVVLGALPMEQDLNGVSAFFSESSPPH